MRDDQRRRTACDQFADDMAARAAFETVVIRQFLMPENLDPSRVNEIQVADLVGGGGDIARDQAFAAGKAGEPAQLKAFAVVVVEPLDGQRGLQHERESSVR